MHEAVKHSPTSTLQPAKKLSMLQKATELMLIWQLEQLKELLHVARNGGTWMLQLEVVC